MRDKRLKFVVPCSAPNRAALGLSLQSLVGWARVRARKLDRVERQSNLAGPVSGGPLSGHPQCIELKRPNSSRF